MIKYYFLASIAILSFINAQAQSIEACSLADASNFNTILNLTLSARTSGNSKFECRFIDSKNAARYISVGLLQSKISYGYDLLTSDFTTNKTQLESGKKIGAYTKFYPYPKGGSNAFYMTGPKSDYTAQSFVLKFRKGDYIVTFSGDDIATETIIQKLDTIYSLLITKL